MAKKNKNKSKAYYAIWGKNGMGVFNSWAKASRALEYLRSGKCLKLSSFEEAKNKALDEYYFLTDDWFDGPLPLNLTVYKKMFDMIQDKFKPTDKIKAVFQNGEWIFRKK